jgi:UDP-N-acetyl-D-glucosamine/UDP-N-acetyl-D-galactosamine dehydrogenase
LLLISKLPSRVLVMGTTFKENVSDLRNSRVPDIIHELRSYGVVVDAVDPYADGKEFALEYGIELLDSQAPLGNHYYDAIIVAVNHDLYRELDEDYFRSHLKEKGILVDLKGIYRKYMNKLDYWSL